MITPWSCAPHQACVGWKLPITFTFSVRCKLLATLGPSSPSRTMMPALPATDCAFALRSVTTTFAPALAKPGLCRCPDLRQ